mgnify:FL=1
MGSQGIVLLLMGVALAIADSAGAEPADWEVDPEHVSVAFDVDHIGYQRQIGMFAEAGGSFRYDPETRELFEGRFSVQADSVFTAHQRRDEHIRNEDFLDADSHPEIVFVARQFVPAEDDTGSLTGDLTMLGTTREVVLDVRINKRGKYPFGHGKETLGISASTTIQRSDWGMDYAVSNGLVGDDVALRFEFEAIRQ